MPCLRRFAKDTAASHNGFDVSAAIAYVGNFVCTISRGSRQKLAILSERWRLPVSVFHALSIAVPWSEERNAQNAARPLIGVEAMSGFLTKPLEQRPLKSVLSFSTGGMLYLS